MVPQTKSRAKDQTRDSKLNPPLPAALTGGLRRMRPMIRRNSRPACVGDTPPDERSNSETPICSSSWWIRRLSVDCLTFSMTAARLTLLWSAAIRAYHICRRSTLRAVTYPSGKRSGSSSITVRLLDAPLDISQKSTGTILRAIHRDFPNLVDNRLTTARRIDFGN